MGRKPVDLSGQTFGRLTVLHRDETKPSGQGKSVYWVCQCECGTTKSVRTDKLRNGDTQSCGCLSKEKRSERTLIDMTGQRFGKLIVLERDLSKPSGQNQYAYWICQCDCGNVTSVRGDHLRDGSTIGCGCGTSRGEMRIEEILKELQIPYKTQYTFNDLIGEKHLRFDFALFEEDKLLCLIEFQGIQHYKCVEGTWDNKERFEKRLQYDQKKRDYCKAHNIKLIEIPFVDYENLDKNYILHILEGIR